ncbi:hypothetical protein M885DRAFT_298341 [Pelagophyceae sp. CCMP2097]|nr:hypothetical protein M885DRAFT_298341 [Pelagophyceae sp. CCMP2097]
MRSWVVVALALLRATPRCAAGEARGGGAGFHIVSRLASETEDVLQPLFALLRSAERGAVDIRRGAIRKDKLTAAVFVDGAAALRAAVSHRRPRPRACPHTFCRPRSRRASLGATFGGMPKRTKPRAPRRPPPPRPGAPSSSPTSSARCSRAASRGSPPTARRACTRRPASAPPQRHPISRRSRAASSRRCAARRRARVRPSSHRAPLRPRTPRQRPGVQSLEAPRAAPIERLQAPPLPPRRGRVPTGRVRRRLQGEDGRVWRRRRGLWPRRSTRGPRRRRARVGLQMGRRRLGAVRGRAGAPRGEYERQNAQEVGRFGPRRRALRRPRAPRCRSANCHARPLHVGL